MRIVHVASEYPPIQVFGLGRAVHDLAVAQAGLGHEVHVVTNSIGGRDPQAVESGVSVHRIDFPPPPKPPDDTMGVIQFNISALETTAQRMASAGEPDVVHAHDWLTVPAVRMLKWLHPSATFAATIHDTAHGKHFGRLDRPRQYAAHLERWAGAEADRLICCSRHVQSELTGEYGCPPGKVSITPCGVDPARFEVDGDLDTFRTLFARPDDRIVLFVGRLDPEKGVDVLLDAMPTVVAAEPRARLLIVGKGRLQETLQAHVRTLGLAGRVEFAGYLSGAVLAAVVRCAEALVIPSLYEPFGIVALEGMVCGAPLVVSHVGGLAEIVEHERTGLVVPPRDPQALAQAVVRLLADRGLASRLAADAQGRASREYGWPAIAEQTVRAYLGEEAST